MEILLRTLLAIAEFLAQAARAVAVTSAAFLDAGARVLRHLGAILLQPHRTVDSILTSRRIAAASAVLCAVGLPAGAIMCFAIAAVSNPFLTPKLAYAEQRDSAVEVIDSDGHWLGILPPASFADWSDGTYLPPDHAAAVPDTIPTVWRRCVVTLEDHNFDGISRWLGIDPLALVKSGFLTLTGHSRRGASTLYMQVVRELEGRTPSSSEAPGALLLRKLAEVFGANALVKMLDDRAAAARLVAMHTPLVIGTRDSRFGNPIYGIALAGEILFGRPVEALTIPQQAVLAAAIKVPVLMAPPGDTAGLTRARARWQRILVRADFCLATVLPKGSPLNQRSRSQLRNMPLPSPAIDPILAALLPRDKVSAWRIAVNPVRRVLYFARNTTRVAREQLDQHYGARDWRGLVTNVRLTVPAAANHDFESTIQAQLRRTGTRLDGLRMSFGYPYTDGAHAADAIAVTADRDDRIGLFYTSHPRLFWSWKTEMASTAKMIAAVILGRYDLPDHLYCHVGDDDSLGPADPHQCPAGGTWETARLAFARSDSNAIAWRLRQLPLADILNVANAFHLPSFGSTPASTALTRGTIEITPAHALEIADAISIGLSGQFSDALPPTILSDVSILQPDGHFGRIEPRSGFRIPAGTIAKLFTPKVSAFVRSVLSATSGSNGTLGGMQVTKQLLGGRLYAKTGTASASHFTYSLHILGTFSRGTRWTPFLLTVGTPNRQSPLGIRLVAGDLSPIANVEVQEALSTFKKPTFPETNGLSVDAGR